MNMIKRNDKMNRRFLAQRGYAMLGIIALVGVAATALVVTSLSATAVQNEQGRKTSSALALAKQALIASAASSNSRPGSLPCPDSNNDGVSDPLSGVCAETVGRLPWQTLGLPDLRDASGERLWYAVSPQFIDATGNVVNSNTTGALSVTGTITANNTVAIVFAPGSPLSAQVRNAENINSAPQYIESYVSPTSFLISETGNTFNDQFIAVSATEIFAITQRRVAKAVQLALNAYFGLNGGYPAPALTTNSACLSASYSASCTTGPGTSGLVPGNPSPAPDYLVGAATLLAHSTLPIENETNWFDKNNWRAIVQYQVSPDCIHNGAPPPSCAGILVVNAVPNQTASVGLNVVPPANQVVSATYSMGVK